MVSEVDTGNNTTNMLDSGGLVAKQNQLQHNSIISRSRIKGLQNSHSNKRLPTWKADNSNSLIVGAEKGVNSPVFERGGIADRSLDRVSANTKITGGGLIMQSRAQLLQNEYKKVIENHAGTISGSGAGKYDDTDYLSRMFTKNPKEQAGEKLGLNRVDSSEVLHKSQSLKMLGDTVAGLGIGNRQSMSVAARMLA